MKQILKGFLSILLVALIATLGYIIYSNYSYNLELAEAERRANETPEPVFVTPTPLPTLPPEGENNLDISIAVLGDLVCHSGLITEAQRADGSYNFVSIFGGANDVAQAADYTICTLETTFPGTGEYAGFPKFRAPDGLAKSLKDAGFDLINTASEHSLDSDRSGLLRTLDVLDEYGLDHVGTYRSQEERDANSGILVKDINGMSIAFLSYTHGTDGQSVAGFEYAVNLIFNDYLTDGKDVDYDGIKADMDAARALNTDLIIVLMHWGTEFETKPAAYQTELADFLFTEGADIILGGHPHVPEPMELRRVEDKQGNEKIGFIIYSLGNFLSCQNDKHTNLTAALNLNIRKNLDTGETYLRNVSYKPMFMVDLKDYDINTGWQNKLWDLRSAITSYENGDNLGIINPSLYIAMAEGLEDIHEILDPAFDEANGGVDVLVWELENRPTRLS